MNRYGLRTFWDDANGRLFSELLLGDKSMILLPIQCDFGCGVSFCSRENLDKNSKPKDVLENEEFRICIDSIRSIDVLINTLSKAKEGMIESLGERGA